MGKYTGKYKGKRGKVDYIEDFLGSEELSGTYDDRKKVAKLIDHEKRWVEDYNRKYLAKIRKEREAELVKELEKVGLAEEIYKQCDLVLSYTLEAAAYIYLNVIREREPAVYRQMFKYLVQPKDISNIGLYLERIRKTGHGPKNKVSLNTIIRIERKVKNIKTKIEVVRDGKKQPLFGRHIA